MKFKNIQEQVLATDKSQLKELNVVVMTNIVLEPYFELFIERSFIDEPVSLNTLFINYENYRTEDSRDILSNSDLNIILLNFDYLYLNFQNDIYSGKETKDSLNRHAVCICEEIYQYIKQQSHAHSLWFGFEDYCYSEPVIKGHVSICDNVLDEINSIMLRSLDEEDVFIDLKRIIVEAGKTNAYDFKGKYRWNSPYSMQLISGITDEIYKQYLIQKRMTPKCVVLDCDNVLWGGILAEDGIENIKLGGSGLGRSYQDFQRVLLTLYYHGVILAVCSKNDISDVLRMFSEHSEMILKEEHISCFQVNWNNKADNIVEISKALNIGLDSMVFIDDSPLELELVKALLPDITSIPYDGEKIYERLSCFNLPNKVNRNNIELRNNTYRTNQKRDVLKLQYQDYDDYLQALEMKIDIHEAMPIEYNRIAELSQRTNRCTNGRRYTVAELKAKAKLDSYKLYSVSVSDKLSDLGLVGAIGIDSTMLDLYCLSCRSLGRNVEDNMNMIVEKHEIESIVYVSTGKNGSVKTLLEKVLYKRSLVNQY